MPYVMAALTVIAVVAMSRWLLSGHAEDTHVQKLPDGSTPDLETGTRPPEAETQAEPEADAQQAAPAATGGGASTNAADLVRQGHTVAMENEAPAGSDETADESDQDKPRTAADIHVEGAGKELDQEVYDAEIAAGKSERTARAKAKAAWVRAQKKAKLAEQEEEARAAAAEEETSGDEAAASPDEHPAEDTAGGDEATAGPDDEADADEPDDTTTADADDATATDDEDE